MSATIRDIADQLGLSNSTVSRVLSNKSRNFISEATTTRVLQAARELGYRPNNFARSLATGRTNMIAYWSPGFHAAFFNKIAYQMHRQLKSHGYETIMGELALSPDTPFSEAGVTPWKVDGIIINGSGDWVDNYLDKHPSGEAPVVRMSTQDDCSADLVWVDLYPASRQAVQSLIDSGRKRIAHMLTASTDHPVGRHSAYDEALSEAGRTPEYILIPEGTRPSARHAIKQYIQFHGRPDALFCANDEMAIGAYRGLRDLGLSIPNDVALVGCDGIEETEYLDTPISTIMQPVDEMCQIAWRFLHNRMNQPDLPVQKAKIIPQLLLRESSGAGT